MNPSVTVYQNNLITMQVERIIREKPEVSRVYTSVGSTGSMLGNSSKNNTASISVKMIDRAERDIDMYDFSQQIKNEIMQRLPGVRALVSVNRSGRFCQPHPPRTGHGHIPRPD